MTGTPVASVDCPAPEAGPLAALALVQKQAIELLTRLDRPPRNLRIQAGSVTVDITWADQAPAAEAVLTVTGADSIGPATGPRDDATAEYLRSPAVGVFYHASEPGAEPFVSVGSEVQPGEQIGIIEAMKLMIPVEAARGGTIVSVIKGNGEGVEYDEPLFALAERA